MPQDTGKFRDTKDQFYTHPDVAKLCIDALRSHIPSTAVCIEPSAGTGVFLDLMPDAVGYDIEPKHPRIVKADFLTVDVPDHSIVFGNPPFGRQSSLAKHFIQHAAKHADIIAFILPRSFKKASMQRAFPRIFHLEEELDLPSFSFLVNESPYDVPCIFQIWKRKQSERDIETKILPIGFAFVSSSEDYDIVFRRVGVNAGKCALPGEHSPQSHYFIKLEDEGFVSDIVTRSQTHVFPSNTTGPRSLTKSEATSFLRACIT
jgi:hypothetical protein